MFEAVVLMKNVLDLGKWTMNLFCHFIEFPEVPNQAAQSVWFWYNKAEHSPLCAVTALQKTELHLSLPVGPGTKNYRPVALSGVVRLERCSPWVNTGALVPARHLPSN